MLLFCPFCNFRIANTLQHLWREKTSHPTTDWSTGPISSSPLLSLVQVPAKLAINLSIHTQHTYDNGVDRTGRQGIKKNTAFTWGERGGKKKCLTPRLCSIWSTVWEQKKNTSAQKHIYHKHMTCNRGNMSSSGKQPSGPVPFITAPVADLLALVAVQSVTEAVEWGRGVMSVVGDGSKRVYTASLSQGSYPDGHGQGAGTGSQKR